MINSAAVLLLQQPLLMLVCEAVTACDRCSHSKVHMKKEKNVA